MPHRTLVVISDLHIGGTYPEEGSESSRGFRLCTHVDALIAFIQSLPKSSRDNATELVINGDFVDFLAEPADAASDESNANWQPFIPSPQQAVDVFRRIACRDAALFDALRVFLRGGGRLTLLLGNHDVELSLPEVRRELESVLDASGRDLAFVYDGEAYCVGPVLIEHGNRYDPWNVVDHDALRRLRSAQSRRESPDAEFTPPAGSHLVAGVMNHIKKDYPFVDLLKPENEVVLPILLALAPEYRRHVFAAARLAAKAKLRRYGVTVQRATLGDAGFSGGAAGDGRAVVETAIANALPTEDADPFIRQVLGDATDVTLLDGDIADGMTTRASVWGWMRLLTVPSAQPLSERLPALRLALQAARKSFDFCRDREVASYLDAAQKISDAGARVVIFGHTHLAKSIPLARGGLYINTGTWADLIRFPIDLLDPAHGAAADPLLAFVDDMRLAKFQSHLMFAPTYARISLVDGELVSAQLLAFNAREI